MSRKEPKAIAHAHEVIMDRMSYATSRDSQVGRMARELDLALKNHLRREDETVNPLVSSFEDLAAGHWPSDAALLAERFTAAEEGYQMLIAEHVGIAKLAKRLRAQAQEEREEEVVWLCDELLMHMQLEEQVLYPAAVIAGRYLTLWDKTRDTQATAGD